ncbi:MAG: hypothetical protein KQH79_05435 [Bacteroidetes bacterium]|nr:hypothetical protein [Bacteroidota bacterium]
MNKLILFVIFVLITVNVMAQTKVVAHRGFSSKFPENTLIAFEKAIKCGADYFELDVRKTYDDSLVVVHDKTINRISSNNMKGTIAKMSYQDLSKVDVGNSDKFEYKKKYKKEKIPLLREVLELAKKDTKICIEIKTEGIEEDVVKMVNNLNLSEEVIIFSFKDSILTKVRQLNKNIPILYLVHQIDSQTLDNAKRNDAFAIGVGPKTIIKQEDIVFFHNNNLEIWKWVVNDINEMRDLIEVGIDGIITDFPDRALKMSNKRRL